MSGEGADAIRVDHQTYPESETNLKQNPQPFFAAGLPVSAPSPKPLNPEP